MYLESREHQLGEGQGDFRAESDGVELAEIRAATE